MSKCTALATSAIVLLLIPSCGQFLVTGPASPKLYGDGCSSASECQKVLQVALKEAHDYCNDGLSNDPSNKTCNDIRGIVEKASWEAQVLSSQQEEIAFGGVNDCKNGALDACIRIRDLRLFGGRELRGDLHSLRMFYGTKPFVKALSEAPDLIELVCQAKHPACDYSAKLPSCNLPDMAEERSKLCGELLSIDLASTTQLELSGCGQVRACMDACSVIPDSPPTAQECDKMCHEYTRGGKYRATCKKELAAR